MIKSCLRKNEHFYRPDFFIRSVCFNSAAVTFVSPQKSNLQYQKKVSGNIQRSYLLCDSFQIAVVSLAVDFALILRLSFTPNILKIPFFLVLSNVLILLGIKAKKLCFQKLAATRLLKIKTLFSQLLFFKSKHFTF